MDGSGDLAIWEELVDSNREFHTIDLVIHCGVFNIAIGSCDRQKLAELNDYVFAKYNRSPCVKNNKLQLYIIPSSPMFINTLRFPPSVKNLGVYVCTTLNTPYLPILNWPVYMESLEIRAHNKFNLDHLPHTLREITIYVFNGWLYKQEDLQNLPSGLEFVKIVKSKKEERIFESVRELVEGWEWVVCNKMRGLCGKQNE